MISMDTLGVIWAEARRNWELGQLGKDSLGAGWGVCTTRKPHDGLKEDPWGCLEEDGWRGVSGGLRRLLQASREMRSTGRRVGEELLRTHMKSRLAEDLSSGWGTMRAGGWCDVQRDVLRKQLDLSVWSSGEKPGLD